jgi:hypothetical protein
MENLRKVRTKETNESGGTWRWGPEEQRRRERHGLSQRARRVSKAHQDNARQQTQ